jgi:hypothetical protein
MEFENQNYIINNFEADDQENVSENSTPKRRRNEYFEINQFTNEAAWQTWLKTEDTWTRLAYKFKIIVLKIYNYI